MTGPNGSGKSTLLKIVAGLVRQTRGTVVIEGDGQTWAEARARRAHIAYAAPDIAFYPELSGRENLLFVQTLRGPQVRAMKANMDANRAVDAALQTVGLGNRGGDRVAVYSSGMRQRLRLAFAYLANAPVLLLDEPSLALDSGGVQIVESLLARHQARGGITLLATNDDREAAWGTQTVDVRL